MRVRTIKDHDNDYGVREGIPYAKRNGRVYEVEDEVAAKNLIEQGLVEDAGNESGSKSGGSGGSGKGAAGAS